MSRILVVEDEEYRRAWFRRYITTETHELDITGDVDEAIGLLMSGDYRILWLDHDLCTEPKVGRDIAKWLIAHPHILPSLNIYVHSVNAISGPKMVMELAEAGRRVEYWPFHKLAEYVKHSNEVVVP